MRVLLCMLLLGSIATVMMPCPAEAQPQAAADKTKVKVAKQYVDAGLAAQSTGDYDTAIEFYSKAYQLVQHPLLIFNMAQAHRLAGRVDQALRLYARYLAEDPNGPQAQAVHQLVAEIEEHRADEARKADEARNAEALRKAEQARDAEQAEQMRKAEEARKAEQARTMETTAPNAEWSMKRKIAVGTGVGGVLTLAVGTVLGVSAKSQQSDAHALCPHPQLACDGADRANDLVRSGHNRAIAADVAFGVGAAAAITAGVLWFTGREQPRLGVAIAPSALQGLPAVTASGSF